MTLPLKEKIIRLNHGLKTYMKKMKYEVGALYYAYRRPDTPLFAKAVAIIVVGYALSPIDLIPDFIPVLGYLDDVILLPLGIALAVKLIPDNIMRESREEAALSFKKGKYRFWYVAVIIVILWLLIIWQLVRTFS